MEELKLHQPGLIGREKELAALKRDLTNALAGKGSLVLISGEPGIGKTRLLDEFKRHASTTDVRLLAGACESSVGRSFVVFSKALEGIKTESLFEEQEYVSFSEILAVNGAGLLLAKASAEGEELDADIFAGMLSAVQDFVRDSFDQSGENKAGLGKLEYGDMKILIEHGHHLFLTAVFRGQEHQEMKNSLRQALQKIEKEHGELLHNWDGKMSELRPVQDEITRLASAKFLVRRDLEGVKLENERIKIADKVLDFIIKCSSERPLLLMLEDMHWADESSLFVLQYLARNIRDKPVLVLGTARPKESKILDSALEKMRKEGIVNELVLEKLEKSDISGIINTVCPENDFPQEFVVALAERCGGTPLFVIEILRHMAEDGSLSRKNNRYSLLRTDYVIPDSVEEVIQSRLVELNPETLAMAEYASCIGKEFRVESAMSIDSLSNPDSALSELQKTGIVLRQNGMVEFCHAMYQEVIYSTISQRWKGAHHKNIGEYFEHAYEGRLEEVLYELARHFSLTHEYIKAINYCVRAGEKAEGQFAAEQAMKFYGDALAALHKKADVPDSQAVEMRTLERLGDLASMLGEYSQAIDFYKRAEEKAGSEEERARMLRKTGEVIEKTGDYAKALESTGRAKSLVASGVEYGRICLREYFIHFLRGEYDKALPLLDLAMETFKEHGARKEYADALASMGQINWRRGEFDKAISDFRSALQIYEQLGEQSGIAHMLSDLGRTFAMKGDLDQAMTNFEKSFEICKKMGDQHFLALSYDHIGNVHTMKGEFSKALASQKEGLRIREKIGDRWGMASSFNNIGMAYLMSGEQLNALEYYKKSFEAFQALGDKHSMAAVLNNLGTINEELDNLDEALQNYTMALEIKTMLEDKDGMAQSLLNMAEIHACKDELDKALDFAARSVRICLENDLKKHLVWNYFQLSEVHVNKREYDLALEYAAKARALTQGGQRDLELGMSHHAMGRVLRDRGELDAASKEFESALTVYEETGAGNNVVVCNYDIALLYGKRGETARAREKLEKVLSEFEGKDMRRWAEKTRKALGEL